MSDDLNNNSEDITIEPDNDRDDSVIAEESQGESIKKLREKLREAEARAKEYLDNLQRAQADFINLRKRDEEDKKEFVKFAQTNLVSDLIPVLDSFTLAIAHGSSDIAPIYSQLLSSLKAYGLEESNPLGEMFDPRQHETVGTIKTEKSEEDHKILEVAQKGYILSGKILRPAKVRIGELIS